MTLLFSELYDFLSFLCFVYKSCLRNAQRCTSLACVWIGYRFAGRFLSAVGLWTLLKVCQNCVVIRSKKKSKITIKKIIEDLATWHVCVFVVSIIFYCFMSLCQYYF